VAVRAGGITAMPVRRHRHRWGRRRRSMSIACTATLQTQWPNLRRRSPRTFPARYRGPRAGRLRRSKPLSLLLESGSGNKGCRKPARRRHSRKTRRRRMGDRTRRNPFHSSENPSADSYSPEERNCNRPDPSDTRIDRSRKPTPVHTPRKRVHSAVDLDSCPNTYRQGLRCRCHRGTRFASGQCTRSTSR
jgi:hypothetical protein